jgi:hypothetical protein
MARMDWVTCIYDSRWYVRCSQKHYFLNDLSYISYHIAILQIRIYALYSLNKKLLVVMLIFYFACSTCSAWIVVSELSSISSMDSSDEQFFIASQSDFFVLLQATALIFPTDGSFCLPLTLPRGIFRYWIPMLSFECLLCVLALFQGFRRFKADSSMFRSGKRLVNNLIRDSVLYFLVCVILSLFLKYTIYSCRL